MTAPETAARAAAEWWARQVVSPTFRLDFPTNRSSETDFVELGMLMLAHDHPVDDEQAARFADAMERRVAADLERWEDASYSVDYGPEGALVDVADEVGVRYSRFPIKTSMWLTYDYVTASLGYGSPSRLIWSRPGWKISTCTFCPQQRWHEGEHTPDGES